MTHAFSFDVTEPTNNNFAGDGDDKIVENQKALKERLELDHWMSGILDTNESNVEGRHKKVTMKALSADPTLLGASIGTCTMAESDTIVGTCTITNADPCVITCAGHGLVTGDKVHFETSDALPTGITAEIIYYVIYLTEDTFSIAETYNNAIKNPIHVSGASAGTVTINVANPAIISKTSHGLSTGEKVYLITTGALPTGLSANTPYYVIEATSGTFKLATSLANAIAGIAIATTIAGSGTHTLYYYNKIKTSSAGSGTHTLYKNNGVIITSAGHGLTDGKRIYFSTDGTLPDPLVAGDNYFVIYIDENTFYLATTHAFAVASKSISVFDAGSGTHTLYSGSQAYGVVYTKVIDSITEMFFIDADTGTVVQKTDNGVAACNVLIADLDCNSKNVISGNFQGTYTSADGTIGYTGTISFNEYLGIVNYYDYVVQSGNWRYYYHRYKHYYRDTTITVKNGLVTSYSNGPSTPTGDYWDVLYYSEYCGL